MTKARRSTEPEESHSVEEFLALPPWQEDETICNYIRASKTNEEGQKESQVLRVTWNDHPSIRFDTQGRFLPDTAMSEVALDELEATPETIELIPIYQELRQKFDGLIYFPMEIYYDLLTLAAISSYFREVFSTYPIIDCFSVMENTGKTHVELCVVYASFCGVCTNNISESALFRTVEDAHGVVGIDEFHNIFYKDNKTGDLISRRPDLYTLVNSGVTRGNKAYRTEKVADGKFKIITYDPFSMKVITRKGPIPKDTASRCITFPMCRNCGFKVINDEDPTPQDFKAIRDQLYVYRLKMHTQVEEVYQNLRSSKTLINRNRNNFYPLLTIAKLISEELFLQVKQFAESYQEQLDENMDPRFKLLVQILLQDKTLQGMNIIGTRIAEAFNTALKESGELQEDHNYAPRTIYGLLGEEHGLGFKRAKVKTHNFVYFDIDQPTLARLKVIYRIQEEAVSAQSTLDPHLSSENDELVALIVQFINDQGNPEQGVELTKIETFFNAWGEEILKVLKICCQTGTLYRTEPGRYRVL